MDCLPEICFLCLKTNIKVQSVLFQDTDGIVVNEKLKCFIPEIIDSTPDAHKLSCSECLEKIRNSYDFKQLAIRNNTIFRDYIEKLQCRYKSHQQLARSKQHTNLCIDDTSKKIEACDEKHDTNSSKIKNENLNITSTNEEQLNTIENIEIINPLIEIEEVYIKQEPLVDDEFNTNYLDEDSKESEDNSYECQICHMGFSSPIYLENHTDSCNKKNQKPDRIDTNKIGDDTVSNHNNKSTSTSTVNEYNKQPNPESLKKRIYKCSECQKAFNRISRLERHTRIHTGEKPHQCDVCDKAFSQKGHLIIHKRIHDNSQLYQCSVCNKTFTQSCHFTTHMRTHTGETPYQCHICDFKCSYSSSLKCHIRSHTGEKPYHCHICQFKCTHNSNLKRHIRTHTGANIAKKHLKD